MPCMNWKLIAVVIGGALVVAVASPGAAAAVIPRFILAACPLAMIVGIALINRSGKHDNGTSEVDELRTEVARLRGDTDKSAERLW